MKKELKFIASVLLICSAVYSASFENLYPINDKKGGGYINKDGSIIIEQKYGFTQRFIGNYAIVELNNKYGVIDKSGNIVIKAQYDDLKNLNENFVVYEKDGKFGYIDILKKQKSDNK